MITFLKIVLAVVVVIVVLAGAAWLWIKRRFKAAIGDYSVANELLEKLRLEPARIHLHRAEQGEYSKDVVALKDRLQQLGFHRMADFDDYDGSILMLLAARHRELPIASALVEDMSGKVSFALFKIDRERHVVGRGNRPMGSFTAARVDWQMTPDMTPEAAFDDIKTSLSDSDLPFDLKLFRAVFEQVHAVQMDQKVVHPPSRDTIAQLSSEQDEPATDEQIDTAFEIANDHWQSQIVEVVLDRYRRTSKMDAVSWDELRDEIQVVHSRIDDDEVADLLIVDEVSEKIFEQCLAQGLTGIELYQAVSQRLPPDQQWTQLGEVDRPIRALLFRPNQDIESDVRTARRYVYEAQDDNEQTVQGSVFAECGADAKQQIAGLGLRNAKLLIESVAGDDEFDDFLVDDKSAAIAARSTKEGILLSMFRVLLSNWWIWAPPTALLIKAYVDGPPYGWGDYLGLAWGVLAALAMVFLIAPMFFYNQLLIAQLKAQPKRQRFWIGMLSHIGKFAGLTQSQLTTERCKALAEEGKLDEALKLRSRDRARLTEEEYQAALIQIYGTAGEWSSLMDAQRAYLAETPAKETATVDLAMSLARYTDDVESAESLIQAVSPDDLPEVAVIGYQYVRGLNAAHRDQHSQALRHYAQAIETARQFESLPIMLGLIAEINGHAALAFKKTGHTDRAQSLWDQVWPILKVHRSSERLIAAYNGT